MCQASSKNNYEVVWDSQGMSTVSNICMDDYYNHSLPLAGYVGAHMIYRALFGEMPPILNHYDEVSYSTVTQKLGDYAQTGCVSMIDDDMIIYKMN